MCVLIFTAILSEIFLSLKIIQQVLSQMPEVRHAKYPLFLSDFNETSILLTGFSENIKVQNVIKNPANGNQVFPCGKGD